MSKTFKIEVTVTSDNEIDSDSIKYALYKKLQGVIVENYEGIDVNIEVLDYWETAKVTQIENGKD